MKITSTLALLALLTSPVHATGSWSAPFFYGGGGVTQVQNTYTPWTGGDFHEIADGGGSLAPPNGVCGTMGSFQITYIWSGTTAPPKQGWQLVASYSDEGTTSSGNVTLYIHDDAHPNGQTVYVLNGAGGSVEGSGSEVLTATETYNPTTKVYQLLFVGHGQGLTATQTSTAYSWGAQLDVTITPQGAPF
jgi:hypothetical protein